MTRVKKEHYVPQFYLKNFSSDGNTVQVYDKPTAKSFTANVRDVANEKYFYDIPELDKEIGVDQFIEKFFHPAEGATATVISQLLDSLNQNKFIRIHPDQRNTLSVFLALQFFRTKDFRNILVQGYEKMTTHLFREVLIHNDMAEGAELVNIKFKEEKEAHLHAIALLDENGILPLADILSNHLWFIGKNETPTTFYTSDNPVVKHGHIKHPVLSFSGLGSKGIEIGFPLSPKYILILADREVFESLKKDDSKLKIITDEQNVIYFNSLQVITSYRQLYSNNSDFSLPVSMCEEHPHLADPNREKVIVNSHRSANRDEE